MSKKVLGLLALFVLLAPALLAAQIILTPTDALSFDYDNTVYTEYSVTGFQVQYDSPTAAWTAITPQSFTDAGTLANHTSYRFIPPYTNGNHTVSVRACNVFGCGAGSIPFSFGYAVSSAPTASPVNFRRVPR